MFSTILIGLLVTFVYYLLDSLLAFLIEYKFYMFGYLKLLLKLIRRQVIYFVMRSSRGVVVRRGVKRLHNQTASLLKMMTSNQHHQDGGNMTQGACRTFEFVRVRVAKKSQYKRMIMSSDLIDTHSEIQHNTDTGQRGTPRKRSGHRAVCNDQNLWIWGGFCPTYELSDVSEPEEDEANRNHNPNRSPVFSELWRFNLTTKRWSQLDYTGDAPLRTVASHNMVLYGNWTLIVYGGTGYPFGQELSNDLYTCNLKTLVWKRVELKGHKPLPVYGHSLQLVDDYLYIMFGTNGAQYNCNVYRVNLKSFESERLFDSLRLIEDARFYQTALAAEQYPDDFLLGRYRQEVVFYAGKIYAFGGGNHTGECMSLALLPAFNTSSNSWEFVNTLPDLETNSYPQKRKFHSCHLMDNHVYIFGGITTNIELDQFSLVENCTWRLSLVDMRWHKLTKLKMLVPTYFQASCQNNKGQIYMHGGVRAHTASEQVYTRIDHLYTVLFKVPKLSDICWTKLIANYPHLLYQKKRVLSDIGIPSSFIERIN